jgi:hypothetical protein
MQTKTIEQIIYHEPFQPFRVVLNDGEEITVAKPRKASVSGPDIAMVGISKKSRRTGGAHKLRIVPLARVKFVEFIEEDR